MASTYRFSKTGLCTALGLSVLVLALMSPQPASADPTLFIGNIKQSGGVVRTTVPVTTLPGPLPSSPVTGDNTAGGDFTIPALAFSFANPGYTFSLPPVYPYIFLRKVQTNEPGNFSGSYWSPGVATTKYASSPMVFPYHLPTPRNATVKLVPGTAGFGGVMRVNKEQTYYFDYAGLVYTYSVVAKPFTPNATNPFGKALPTPASIYGTKRVAHATQSLNPCCTTRIKGATAPSVSGFGASSVGPWATGMLYVNDAIGASNTTTTQTGVDNRTAFNSGVISLVSPRVQHVYDADGTSTSTLVKLRESFSMIQVLDLQFAPAPEPGTIALLAGGVLGLAGLARMRRRR